MDGIDRRLRQLIFTDPLLYALNTHAAYHGWSYEQFLVEAVLAMAADRNRLIAERRETALNATQLPLASLQADHASDAAVKSD